MTSSVAAHRRCRRRGRRHDRRLVRVVPARGRASPTSSSSRRRTLGAGASPRAAGHGPGPGRHRGRRAARPVQPRLLRRPAGAARHRLRLRRPGLLHAVLLRARGRARRTTGSPCSRRSASTCAGSGPTSSTTLNPAMARGKTLGGSYAPGDGYIDPPRNVLAYTAALFTLRRPGARAHRVHRAAAATATGSPASRRPGERSRPDGSCSPAARRWPRSAGRPASGSRPVAPATRSWSRAPSGPGARPAADGLRRGLGHLLAARGGRRPVGDEQPGRAAGRGHRVRLGVLRQVRSRVAKLLPATADLGLRRAWAATIDFTPDHLPILGPADRRRRAGAGTVVAAAGGHGMMWGPGVSKVAADLVVAGATDVLDVTDLGLDRFDEHGRSRLGARPDRPAVPGDRVLTPAVRTAAGRRGRRRRPRRPGPPRAG